MDLPSRKNTAQLLQDLKTGKEGAADALLPLLYDELRAMARHFMHDERSGHTLQTTALVHEAYIRMGGGKEETWEDKAQYLRLAAMTMRRVLIDHARRKRSEKHGGARKREPLEGAAVLMGEPVVDLIALDNALEKLHDVDPQLARVVELRFVGTSDQPILARVRQGGGPGPFDLRVHRVVILREYHQDRATEQRFYNLSSTSPLAVHRCRHDPCLSDSGVSVRPPPR